MKGAKMTKKRRKRRQIQTECEMLSVKGLPEFINKLKHRLKNLARTNRQREARQKQRKWDDAFQRDQGSVFKGEHWVKLNFQAQLHHNVSYLRSNCE